MLSACLVLGQTGNWTPDRIQVSYFGEQVTRPGLRVAAQKSWTLKERERKDRTRTWLADAGLGVGGFYHRRYMTGLFLQLEGGLRKVSDKGRFVGLGGGTGYLRSFLPNVWEVGANGTAEKVSAGHGYFIWSVHAQYGSRLHWFGWSNVSWHLKPQLLVGLPYFPKSVQWLALEVGLSFELPNSKS